MSNYEHMRKTYLSWRRLSEVGLQIGVENAREASRSLGGRTPGKIIVIGMGGSGIIGDFLKGLGEHYSFPTEIEVLKSAYIRGGSISGSLALVISYSGETSETLKAVLSMGERPAALVGITSGGSLENALSEMGVPILKLPGGYLPRAAFPLMLYSALGLLSELNLTGRLSLGEILNSMSSLEHPDAVSEEAARLSELLSHENPFFITTHREYMPVGIRLRNELAENAKALALVEELPEWFHNLLEAYLPDELSLTVIEGKLSNAYGCYVESMRKALGVNVIRVSLQGEALLEEYVHGAWLAGLLSLEIARRRGVDPFETKRLRLYREFVRGECA